MAISTIDSTGLATKGIAQSNMYAGAVLQVVTAAYSTQASTTANTYTDSGLTATITPSSSTSKILVIASMQSFGSTSGSSNIAFQIVRTSTSVQEFVYANWGGMVNASIQAFDSPATTSATTYKVQFKLRSGSGTAYTQYADANGQGTSFLTLMEIAQ